MPDSTQGAATFFPTPDAFRAWLQAHHQSEDELLVGFYKKASGRPSITWPESVDEALCFGWIDGVRRRIDEQAYSIRFTPRRPKSIWSAVNIKRVEELTKLDKMQPAGVAAYQRRIEAKSKVYSYEQQKEKGIAFDPEFAKRFQRNRKAWKYFEAQAPSYRKQVQFWVQAAKKQETRERRLAKAIKASADEQRLRW